MNADNELCGLADEQADLVVEVFRMLADATRVQLLWALADRELSVNDLAARVNKPGPSVSQHLAKLRMARLVRTAAGRPGVLRLGTTMSASSSPTPCTTPNTPGACTAHHLDGSSCGY